jgi:hypothetical protein
MDEDIQLVIDSIEGLRDDLDMVQQPRSNFALKHFVIGQHDLPGRQRAQAILELQAKLFGIKRSKIARERVLLLIERQNKLFEAGDAMAQQEAQLEIQSAEIDIAEIDLGMLGAVREANTLLAILSTMPRYTREELEAEEGEYWKRRLTRQYVVGQRDLGGNLDAVLQVMTEPGTAKPTALGTYYDDVVGLLGGQG